MAAWTMADAKKDFERGLLWGFTILPAHMEPGWTVRLDCTLSSNPVDFLVDAHKKQVRIFKTLDAAVSALHQIGFEVKQLRSK